jgi:Zn-dependent protease
MPIARKGAIHLFRVVGIDVFLHWTWFVVAAIEVGYMRNRYSSLFWSILEYLSLFLIVLLHEFGHALACRQVGGAADLIMLWPLGGVAYVNPPQRPGATLWSIAAGPLVNVLLLAPLIAGLIGARMAGWAHTLPDAYTWIAAVLFIDVALLAFNLLPVYPLDGGQILRSLLWFFLGRARSLAAATAIGFAGAAVFVMLALWWRSIWLVVIAGYMLMSCWRGMKGAWILLRLEKLPRRDSFTCPACGSKPPVGAHWKCSDCGGIFDTFGTLSVCPHCHVQHFETVCLDCRTQSPMSNWSAATKTRAPALPGTAPVAP